MTQGSNSETQHRPQFQWRFLAPRYWGVWLAVLVAGVFAFVPYRLRDRIAASIGKLGPRLTKRGYRNAQVNLQLCFPDWDNDQRHRVIVEMYQRAAQVLLSYSCLLLRSPEFLERRVRLVGEEHLLPLLEAGKPVILMVPHTWAIEFPGLLLAKRGYPMTTMMNPDKNPLVDWLMCRLRARYGGKLFARKDGIKQFLNAIRDGHSAYYLPDQDHGMAKSEYVPFFATHKATLPGLGRMTESTGAVVVPMLATYDPATGYYEGHIRPPLWDLPSGDREYDARRMNEEIEVLLTSRPEQYMWNLKLLKSRPEGEPDPYRAYELQQR
ncbi:lipid A biosynthesis (KDO)2-(lauroyl)-lipid IVA acyltransferase [Ferrimonas balearica DSM 9799]|uniref:Lipid A biosynthesis acyltransferase n=1 Tax=Ferrimonas balearica (strain DSM 9799 / CCM 4581 / KCTC 23876 / PAT) TaxID=550540 RepID=E1SVN0_FERBD|nr:lauroyl-Kdo(2)-lipid IV(A) myristoyltransferase [Ferrimonas balearica]ADN76361.1 lipid A biosynthesis (KDO)2-(lauroyl)-lipid IVA acyltransferase [Ferrimonas balearica DSM 9799]